MTTKDKRLDEILIRARVHQREVSVLVGGGIHDRLYCGIPCFIDPGKTLTLMDGEVFYTVTWSSIREINESPGNIHERREPIVQGPPPRDVLPWLWLAVAVCVLVLVLLIGV